MPTPLDQGAHDQHGHDADAQCPERRSQQSPDGPRRAAISVATDVHETEADRRTAHGPERHRQQPAHHYACRDPLARSFQGRFAHVLSGVLHKRSVARS